ncbi:MAG: MFS transporter [Pseudomonadota bacterium]
MLRKPVLGWAMYDWANSAYATTVMAGFFPVFFRTFWSGDSAETTFRLGLTNSLASLTIALMAPVLGAIADRGGRRKGFLYSFAALGIVMTACLFMVAQGQWQAAALAYGLATIGFAGSVVFYDSLLVDVAEPEEYEWVSSLGIGLGYLGGGLLFALNVLMVRDPAMFGLADANEAVRYAFLSVGVWWAIFTIPIALHVREDPTANRAPGLTAVRDGLRQFAGTLREVRKQSNLLWFLAAYWLYIDGVYTIIKMAVDYGMSLGIEPSDLLFALLVTQFVGFPSAIVFGWFGARVGARAGLFVAIGVYLAVTVWATQLEDASQFFGVAIVIGMVQGGVQSLSRALYARLIPPDKSGEYFGFFNMLGKFAAVLGPVLSGWVTLYTGSGRAGILSIAVLFIVGAALLTRVKPAPVS